jgi:hypothetical protein
MTLRPCPSCARHVRVSESRCPFCGAAVSSEGAANGTLPGRLSRAALFTFRTTVAAAALAGCGPTAQVPPETTIAQPYGAPPNPDPIPPSTVTPPPATDPGEPPPLDPTPDPGMTSPAYGAAPPPTPAPTTTTHAHRHPTTPTDPEPGAPASAYGAAPEPIPPGL